jgi:VCBS repeat-containing protein
MGNVLTNDTDPDSGDTRTVTAVNGSALNVGVLVAGIYGTLTLGANGSWTYALNDADPDTNALAQGQAATDAFTYTVTDASGATSSTALTIAITGANDAPVAVDDANGSDLVIESGVNPGNTPFAGDPSASGNLLANDTDVDAGDTRTVTAVEGLASEVGVPVTGTFGTFVINADGSWTYTLDNNDDDTQALGAGATGVKSIAYTITDASGASSTATLFITVQGTNDAPNAVPDDNNGDPATPLDPTASGNALSNDTDPDTGDSKTVVAVSASAFNVGLPVVGIYGTLRMFSNGDWTYTLDPDDPDTATLPADVTANDQFTYTMQDAAGATSVSTLNITVSGGLHPPSFNTIGTHNFITTSEPGNLVFINGISYEDLDSFGQVNVTISTRVFSDALFGSNLGGVTVSGSGSNEIRLTGTIADINAYIYGNNIRWDPEPGDFDRDFTFEIDDNGFTFGGAVVITTVHYDHRFPSFHDFESDFFNFAGWNINNAIIDLGFGFANDEVITAWSHGPFPNDIRYLGGDGFDTITLVFTPAQLEAILANTFDRSTLQNYLDGDVGGPFGDDTLSLGATSWNASVFDFEDASLALASGPDGFVRYDAIGDDLPDFDSTPDGSSDTTVGTSGADTISGFGGNDILVGLGGNDTLNGDTGSGMLLGGSGNDTLRARTGNDILSGGTGADRFIFAETGFLNVDRIVDYSFVAGDTIDLSALLDPLFSPGQDISGFVRAVESGSNITIQVDQNGGANSFVDVVTLTEYDAGPISDDLVRVTFEGVDHVLIA